MRCYQRPLLISYKDHITKEEVHRKIKAAIEEYDELRAMDKKQTLTKVVFVPKSTGLAGTVLQGTMDGKKERYTEGEVDRRRGRQKKRQTEEELRRQY